MRENFALPKDPLKVLKAPNTSPTITNKIALLTIIKRALENFRSIIERSSLVFWGNFDSQKVKLYNNNIQREIISMNRLCTAS